MKRKKILKQIADTNPTCNDLDCQHALTDHQDLGGKCLVKRCACQEFALDPNLKQKIEEDAAREQLDDREGVDSVLEDRIFKDIVESIASERSDQLELYDADHDSGNSAYDWVAIICVHAGRAIKRGRGIDGWKFNQSRFREAMVKVAALAIAAIEWCDAGAGGRDGHGN